MKLRIAILVGAVWLLCGCQIPPALPAPAPTGTPSASPTPTAVDLPLDSAKLDHVKVEPVLSAPMPGAEVTAPGRVEANPNLISHIYLPVAGRVQNVLVRTGDPVSAGQTLLTVLSPDATQAQTDLREADSNVREARDSLIEANIAVTKARTALRKAEIDYQRVRDLYKHDAIAKKEVLTAETDLAQARSDLQNTRAMVDQAQAGIDSAVAGRDHAQARLRLLGVSANDPNPEISVPAPLTGKVLELEVVAGEYHSDLGNSVMTVVDLSSVWVTSNVAEADIRWIEVGEPVHITLDAFPNQRFEGKVARIADVLDPKTRTIKVMTELRNPSGRFRPEMFGRIHHVHDAAQMPVVPPTAIVQKGDGSKVVYVQTKPGTFEPRVVEVGQREGDRVAITRGISPGERVVVDGALLLRK